MAVIEGRDGTKIFYTDAGGWGEPVLLVHGLGDNARIWDPVTERLAATHRVIAPDLRGHGRSAATCRRDMGSMAADLRAVINETGIHRPHLVGHALGGLLVSTLAATQEAASVVCINQPLQLRQLTPCLNALASVASDQAAFASTAEAMFEERMGTRLRPDERRRILGERRLSAELVLGAWQPLANLGVDEGQRLIEAILSGYCGRDVAYLGVFGSPIDPGYGPWLGRRIPDADLERWQGHGHYPHLVDPDKFVARLLELWLPLAPGWSSRLVRLDESSPEHE